MNQNSSFQNLTQNIFSKIILSFQEQQLEWPNLIEALSLKRKSKPLIENKGINKLLSFTAFKRNLQMLHQQLR